MVKYVINKDWLEFILTGQLVEYDAPLDKYQYDQGKIVLTKKLMGNTFYKYGYDVFIDGQQFAECFVAPRSEAILDPNYISLKLMNNVLYELDTMKTCEYLFTSLKWNVRNTSRLDLALDGHGFMAFHDKWRFKKKYWKKGKAQYKPFYEGGGWGELKQFTVGSKASSKWVSCYNKGKEIEKSNKQYIKESWIRAGLSMEDAEDVERLEVAMRNEEIKKIIDFDWRRLDDFEYLASLMCTSFVNFFEFQKVSKTDVNRARWKSYELIDWDAIGGAKLERMSTQQSNETDRYKKTVKNLYWLWLETHEVKWAEDCQEIAEGINCLDWYIEHMEKWESEFWNKCGHNKHGVIKFQFLPGWKSKVQVDKPCLFTHSY